MKNKRETQRAIINAPRMTAIRFDQSVSEQTRGNNNRRRINHSPCPRSPYTRAEGATDGDIELGQAFHSPAQKSSGVRATPVSLYNSPNRGPAR